MLLHVPEVLDASTMRSMRSMRSMRAALDAADWEDGRCTAGAQGAAVKHNLQLPAGDLMLYPATSLHRVAPVTRRRLLLAAEPGP